MGHQWMLVDLSGRLSVPLLELSWISSLDRWWTTKRSERRKNCVLKCHPRRITFANGVFQASHVHFSVFVLWFGLGGLCISTGKQQLSGWISAIHIHANSHDIPTTTCRWDCLRRCDAVSGFALFTATKSLRIKLCC